MTNPQFACCPQELQKRRQFVTWKDEHGTKVPYDAKTGRKASSTDPSTWATFDEAVLACRRRHHKGIGYVFSPDDPFVGIDLDDCRNPDTGELEPWAREIVATMDSYFEVSPSGTGVKGWVIGDVPSSAKTKQIEIYPSARYFTITGLKLPEAPPTIRNVNGELTALYRRLKPEQPKPTQPTTLPRATVDTDHARRYALAALEAEHQAMLAAGEGERHNTRIRAAYALAGYHPHISEDEITAALAVNFGANEASARKAIADGIRDGKANPRQIPEPTQHEPTFDAHGHACCPTHGQRLIACFNGHGYRCPAPKLADPFCFWWQGDGYVPPVDVAVDDDLDSLTPDELRRRLRAVTAERDRWKSQAQHLDEWRTWALEIVKLETQELSPAAKVAAISLWPELKSNESRGVDTPQRIYIGDPEKKDGAAARAGLSPGTFGAKLKELEEVGAIVRTEDRQSDGKKKVLVRAAAFFQPTAYARATPRNHGGERPQDRPAPACPTHGYDAPVVEETTETWLHLCGDCEKPLAAGQRKPQRRAIWAPNTQFAPIEKTVDPYPNTQVAGRDGPDNSMVRIIHEDYDDLRTFEEYRAMLQEGGGT